MSWSEAAYAYLKKHREYTLRDLEALRAEAGKADQIVRLERSLAHIDAILDAYPVKNDPKISACSTCKGKGVVRCPRCLGNLGGMFMCRICNDQRTVACPDCDGQVAENGTLRGKAL